MSACLLGVRCRYDGTSKTSPGLIRLAPRVCMIPVCPEQLGGLPTPRPPAVIQGGDGRDVLACLACVAVLKDRSPSCGLLTPYCDRPGGGLGVAAALLDSEGVRVVEVDSSGAPPPGLEELAAGSAAPGKASGDRAGRGV